MRIPASAVAATTIATAILGGLFAWAAIAMGVDRAPPPKTFVQGGETYRWSVAHGLTGSIAISGPIRSFTEPPSRPGDQPTRVETGNMYLVLTCSGMTSGGLQARFYAPKPPTLQLRLRTDDAVFRVRPRANDLGGANFVEGQGDLPDGYLQSLARTETVSVEYADQATTFPGPGKALTEHFGRYCRQLAQRASHDE
jgi:hypothetical protein